VINVAGTSACSVARAGAESYSSLDGVDRSSSTGWCSSWNARRGASPSAER
jgi:hypothetical protein